MLYCTKCKSICEDSTQTCPNCKRSRGLRPVKPEDDVFFLKVSEGEAAELALLFEQNAVRHAMGDEDPLHIDISVAPEGESMVQIQVKDDGVGMDEQTAARLFCTQQKAPRTDAPQGGGAGVAMHNIADRIARFYGPRSSTQVISSPGAGTSVVLHLDLQKSILE